MRRQLHILALMIVAVALMGTGCSFDDDGIGRSVVEVVAVNEGAPFLDGQLNAGSDKQAGTIDDFVPNGQVSVTVRNRDYNAFINAPDETPYGQFNITQVQVEWQPLVAGTAADNLPAFNRTYNFNVSIPKGEAVTFNVLVVTFEMKQQSFLLDLLPPGLGGSSAPSFQAQAHVKFVGYDSGAPGNLIELEGTIPVEFIGVIVE